MLNPANWFVFDLINLNVERQILNIETQDAHFALLLARNFAVK
jgi:hypothetical protein